MRQFSFISNGGSTLVESSKITWNEVLRCLQLVQPKMIPDQDRFHNHLLYIFEEPHRLTEINKIAVSSHRSL